MSAVTKYTCVTKVEKSMVYSSVHWKISVEINGFEGEGEGYSIGTAFEAAYDDAVAKLAAGTAEGSSR